MNKRQYLHLIIIEQLRKVGVEFGKDPHSISMSQAEDLHEWAKAIRYKPSATSSLSLGRQFYVFLSKIA